MNLFLTIINIAVALLFCYIFYLETIATTSDKTLATFNADKDMLAKPIVQNLFKNQGVYNGLLSIGLLYACFFSPNPIEISRLIHLYIIGVALYGAVTVKPKVLVMQGGLSIIWIVLSFLLK